MDSTQDHQRARHSSKLCSTIPAGRGWSSELKRGEIIRIVDLEGNQAVDFLCYNAADLNERYNAPNTIKAAQSLRITVDHQLFSDLANPLLTILVDTSGIHDTIGGCCSKASNEMLYGVEQPGCRETFLSELAKFGMDRRDIVPNVNFFSNVPVLSDNRLADTVFVSGGSLPGDYVELRAEMDTVVVLSNCRQTNNPCNDGRPTPIHLDIYVPD